MANVITVPKQKKNLIEVISNSEAFWGYSFLLPIIIGFLVFTAFPVVMSMYYSLTRFDGITTPIFIGLENYRHILTDSVFLRSLWNTVYFTLGTVPLGTFIALVIAVMLNSNIKFMSIFRAAYFIPVIVSMVSVAMVWQWMYQPEFGLINAVLGRLGLPQPRWLASMELAMPSVIAMSIWRGLGFTIVIYLAGLSGISSSVYEAADIDGASTIQKFFHLTIPLLRHTTLFVLVIGMIGAFQAFDQIYIMTRGGPARATQVVVYMIYTHAFQYFRQGMASAMAYVLFIIIFIGSIIQMKISQSKDVV